MPDDSRFCTECGARFPEENPAETGEAKQETQPKREDSAAVPEGSYTYAPTYAPNSVPGGDPVPGEGSPYQPVSTLGWMGILLLLCIPLVNLVLAIVWACGGCRKVTKSAYARAWLLMMVLGLILTGVLGGVCYSIFTKVFSDPATREALESLMGGAFSA